MDDGLALKLRCEAVTFARPSTRFRKSLVVIPVMIRLRQLLHVSFLAAPIAILEIARLLGLSRVAHLRRFVRPMLRNRILEYLDPFLARGSIPVALDDANGARYFALPVRLPMLGARVVEPREQ